MDYITLTGSTTTFGSIASWINHGAVVNVAPNILEEAQSWIYRRLRHWRMSTSVNTNTMTASQDFIPLPADYLEDIDLIITGTGAQRMIRKPATDVRERYSYDSNGNRVVAPPNVFYNDQSNFKFDTYIDQSYPYDLLYYQQPPLLGTNTQGGTSTTTSGAGVIGGPTNFLTQFYPRLLRCASMAAACEFMKDMGQGEFDRTYWDQLAQDELDRINEESDRAVHTQEAGMILK